MVHLDLGLPKIGGHEVLRRIRENPKTSKVAVVIVNSSDYPLNLEQAYDSGCNSYVSKPVEFCEFTRAIAQLGLYSLLINTAPEDQGALANDRTGKSPDGRRQ